MDEPALSLTFCCARPGRVTFSLAKVRHTRFSSTTGEARGLSASTPDSTNAGQPGAPTSRPAAASWPSRATRAVLGGVVVLRQVVTHRRDPPEIASDRRLAPAAG